MSFIELHWNGDPRLIAINRISALGCDNNDTFIWLVGDPDCFYVDETYEEIKNILREAGIVWNV
jgi:hypothetical protein